MTQAGDRAALLDPASKVLARIPCAYQDSPYWEGHDVPTGGDSTVHLLFFFFFFFLVLFIFFFFFFLILFFFFFFFAVQHSTHCGCDDFVGPSG